MNIESQILSRAADEVRRAMDADPELKAVIHARLVARLEGWAYDPNYDPNWTDQQMWDAMGRLMIEIYNEVRHERQQQRAGNN